MSFGPPFALNLFSSTPSQFVLAASVNSKPPSTCASSTSVTTSSAGLVPSLGAGRSEMSAETLRILSAGHPGFNPALGLSPPGMADHAGFPPLPSFEQYRLFGNPFYPAFPNPLELKGSEGGFGGPLPPPPPGYFFDAGLGGYGGPLDFNGARRKNATRETTAALKAWLYEHRKNPYPTKGEKIMLAIITKMTLTQVSTWFANARRRLKKENKMTWSPRNRPGEDDEEDDDLGAADDAVGHRSSSSLSDADGATLLPPGKPEDPDESLVSSAEDKPPIKLVDNTFEKTKSEPKCFAEKRAAPETNEPIGPTPKKTKIWSIADTVACSSSSDSAAATDSTQPSPATSAGDAEKKTDSGPYHFSFVPWQQQMGAMSNFGYCRPPAFGHPFSPPMFGAPTSVAQFRPELFGPRGLAGLLAPHPALLGPNPHLGGGVPPFFGSTTTVASGSKEASSSCDAVSPVSSADGDSPK